MECYKRTFNSMREANEFVNQTNKTRYSRGRRVSRGRIKLKGAYKCPNCGKYHTTSKG